MTQTVGDLRKLLEQYPDDLVISIEDEAGYSYEPLEVIGKITLGLFSNAVTRKHSLNPYYRRYKLYDDEEHIRDVEVLILG